MIMKHLFTIILAISLMSSSVSVRVAMIVTLSGTHKLSDYFEWSCRTIGKSADLIDMIVFHEGNSKLQTMHCAENVKFIDLSENGLAKLIVSQMVVGTSTSESIRGELTTLLSEIILHVPRYLIEIKPMTGSLFKDWLSSYTHWTYTDPDIIWGNVSNWIDLDDLNNFDIITFSKTFDAARLFIRGQFAVHKNTEKANNLWKSLSYLKIESFAKRIGNAVHMIKAQKSSDEVMSSNFNSAEGWYSDIVLQSCVKEGLRIKIASRGFDDFSTDPVILSGNNLVRCSLSGLEQCIANEMQQPNNLSVQALPPIQMLPARGYHHKTVCRMMWLPNEVRYCLAHAVYDKDSALASDKQDSLRIDKVGEAFLLPLPATAAPPGTVDQLYWSVNNEKEARRQTTSVSTFFHFRHWDDYLSTGTTVTWNAGYAETGDVGCMVMHIRGDKKLAFESCEVVLRSLRRAVSTAPEDEKHKDHSSSSSSSSSQDSQDSHDHKHKSKSKGKRRKPAKRLRGHKHQQEDSGPGTTSVSNEVESSADQMKLQQHRREHDSGKINRHHDAGAF